MTNKLEFLAVLDHLLGRSNRHPRNGKVARLPEHTRNLINQMLDDGRPYRAILLTLRRLGPSAVPCTLSEMNLSHWKNGGYQDWLNHQQREAANPNPIAPNRG